MAGDGMLFISLERDSISVLVLRSIDPEAEAALGEVLLQLQVLPVKDQFPGLCRLSL